MTEPEPTSSTEKPMALADLQPGTLASAFLTLEEIERLHSARRGSRTLFDVGDVARGACARLERKYPKFLILAVISEESGLGWRRIGKLMSISEKFLPEVRERFPDMPFSYFEEAIALPDEWDKIAILEFAEYWYTEHSRWPGADNLLTYYRRHALGLEIGHPVIMPPPEPPEPPRGETGYYLPAPQNNITAKVITAWHSLITMLQETLKTWRTNRATLTVERCIEDLEKIVSQIQSQD